jgi:hypothetical protein
MDIFFSDLPQSLLAHAGKVVPWNKLRSPFFRIIYSFNHHSW